MNSVSPPSLLALPCVLALAAAPVLAQGGTLISESPSPQLLGSLGYYGDSLASIDDGTGRYDLLIGEPAFADHGYLLDGRTGAIDATVANTESFSGTAFGRGLDGVSDLDGDGVEDFAISAPGNQGGGVVFLYLRKPGSEPVLWNVLAPPGPELFQFGFDVAGLEDLDGDGVGDLVVGQKGAEFSGVGFPGFAYVYSGATGALIHTLGALPGGQSQLGFGKAVTGVPDVDGDGLEDVAVAGGSSFPTPGIVRVFSGATGALIQQIDTPFFTTPNTWGRDLVGVEDFNGDGRGDLLIGAPSQERAQLFSAIDGEFLGNLTPPAGSPVGQFGYSVSGGVDIDGDGTGDVLVGSPFEIFDGPWQKGRAYLFSGVDGSLLRTYERPDFYTPAQETNEFFGRSVLLSPDLNGDGRGDVVIGAPILDVGVSGDGAVFAFYCLDEVEATADVRLGTPPNPQAFSTSGTPQIGGDWSPTIDHAAFVPGALLDLALFSLAEANLPTSGGTLLVDPAQLLFTLVDGTAAGQFEVPIPSDCALVGRTLSAQGISWDGAEFIGANALDLRIGSF